MPSSKKEKAALAAIKAAYGMDGHEDDVTLFVSHHLEELEPIYWERLLGTATPEPGQILGTLVSRPRDQEEDDEEGDDTLDFTLPEDATDYVLCVTFDEEGEVEDISMES